MTRLLFREDPYLREATGRVTSLGEGVVGLDATIFYPQGGGQPGDTGALVWDRGEAIVVDCIKGAGETVLLKVEGTNPPIGGEVHQRLDWARRYGHMRVHTALHLLSVALPLPVTGGAIAATKGRLDFDMPEAPADREALEAALASLVARDLPVAEDWITDDELLTRPQLVKTMSVAPPTGQGRVRLIRIGSGSAPIDLQPCGGTHVARTGEVGRLTLGKIEKKGARNRRVTLHLAV